jgi:dTDP-glucose pyrophosphorylase
VNYLDSASSEIVAESATVLDAVMAIESSESKTVFVLDAQRRLIGSVTDGDVRRGILRGITLADSVARVMNKSPISICDGKLSVGERDLEDARFVAVTDRSGLFLGVLKTDKYSENLPNTALVMAGGKGSRLKPYTDSIPKPLVEVGGQPLIVSLLGQLKKNGFSRVYVSVNHMAQMIMDRLGDGTEYGLNLSYLQEDRPLGTAGSLSLIPERQEWPILVTNADLRTACNFRSLVAFHEEQDASITVAVRSYLHEVPFGVVDVMDQEIVGLREKPILESLVSAGIYCLAPVVLARLQKNEYLDMPDLIREQVESSSSRIVPFPIHEEWADIGRPEDLEKARMSHG